VIQEIILAGVQARGGGSGSHIHLSPADFNAIWHLTQWLGREFWHMGTVAQCVVAGVPGIGGMVWLQRWNPLESPEDKSKRRRRKTLTRG
jgi:hypothetical protein